MSTLPFTPAPVAVAAPAPVDGTLTVEVLTHLDRQLISARRLLGIVLDQGAAIRRRDVHQVVSCTGLMQAELQRRAAVEGERAQLLQRAGVHLRIDPGAVTIEQLSSLMDPASAVAARAASAELRGILHQVELEHHTNRALMQQELGFLDHLLKLVDVDHQVAYASGGVRARRSAAALTTRPRVLDMQV